MAEEFDHEKEVQAQERIERSLARDPEPSPQVAGSDAPEEADAAEHAPNEEGQTFEEQLAEEVEVRLDSDFEVPDPSDADEKPTEVAVAVGGVDVTLPVDGSPVTVTEAEARVLVDSPFAERVEDAD